MLEALLAGGTVETLDLGANGLTGAGFEALLPGLAACSSLQTLEVNAPLHRCPVFTQQQNIFAANLFCLLYCGRCCWRLCLLDGVVPQFWCFLLFAE